MTAEQEDSEQIPSDQPLDDAPKKMARRHDLDSLRAVAMLLGIVLHGSLAYFFMPIWPVQDSHQNNDLFGGLFLGLHGFRMPLFFLISGFFTAMLWRYRGMESLVQHRFKRIFLPLSIGVLTIVPLMNFVSAYVSDKAPAGLGINTPGEQFETESPIVVRPVSIGITKPKQDIFASSFTGDLDGVIANLSAGVDVDAKDKDKKSTPLQIAAFARQKHIVEFLIKKNADLYYRNIDGVTALDIAYLVGALDIAEILQAAMEKSPPPVSPDSVPPEFQEFMLPNKAAVDSDGIASTYWAWLNSPNWKTSNAFDAFNFFHTPVFHHLWFLWFLCWLVVAFIFYGKAVESLKMKQLPNWLVVSPLRYLLLIPLTMIAQHFMTIPIFGPDTSAGLIPYPHMLLYYGIFFFFGAIYFDVNDDTGKISMLWPIELVIGIALFFCGVEAATGDYTTFETLVSPDYYGLLNNFIQVSYAWVMTFGFMGLFRVLFSGESKVMRYVSDSSYWLYLMHLPLILFFQHAITEVNLPATIKLTIACTVTSGLLLLTYEYSVRYTPIGTLLNGKKVRSPKNKANPG